jgi:HPt (histidine-containing phosphotransfer) domain-containing protein
MQSDGATVPHRPAAGEPPIDRTHLARMTLGDPALAREVLALFDRQIETLLGRIDASEPAGVPALAHTLKGSARGVGAWPMARAAEALETAPAAARAAALAALVAAAAETRAVIADILGGAAPQYTGAARREPI